MIARIWYGRTPEKKKKDYVDVIRRTGVDSMHALDGNRGVYVMSRTVGEEAEFIVLSFWDSMEAIRKFAGPDPGRAVYYPEDDDYLREKTAEVIHYEVHIAPVSG
jgi:heme-degrading monooxygenase HmoA